jgi:TetR/AcrR family transcriptional regulator, regulator of autoinduction and epiphytic fitness
VLIAEAPRFPELGRLLTEPGKLPYLNRLSGYLKGGELWTFGDPRHSSISGDDLGPAFWPAMLSPDFSVSDRDTNQAVEEAVLTLMARYEVARD